MLSLRPSSFLAPTEGGVRSCRGGRHNQSRLKTMSMDGASVRKASATTTTGQAVARLELRRVLVAVPSSRRKPAGGYGDISRPPLLELRWTGPKTCERWSPYKNADDGSQPSLCAATRKADVSTKVGQSPLHWSRHTASTATTACPRFCFMVMPHRHHLDCFVFCDRSLQRKHRFTTVFLEQGKQCAKLDPFSGDTKKFATRIQLILCILASGRTLAVMLSPPVSSLSVARNHRLLRSATRPCGLPALKLSDRCQVSNDNLSPLVSERPEHASV